MQTLSGAGSLRFRWNVRNQPVSLASAKFHMAQGKMDALRKAVSQIVRKIELHLHLDGSLPPELIRKRIERMRLELQPGTTGSARLEDAALRGPTCL